MKHIFTLVERLNQSKYFLGFLIIFLNISSKFITIKLNHYHEQFFRDTVGHELIVFSICFIGTRDILVALAMSSLFIMLNDYLLNTKSTMCIIPKKYQDQLKSTIDTNNDDYIDENEIKRAIAILNKSHRQKNKETQRKAYLTFMNNL